MSIATVTAINKTLDHIQRMIRHRENALGGGKNNPDRLVCLDCRWCHDWEDTHLACIHENARCIHTCIGSIPYELTGKQCDKGPIPCRDRSDNGSKGMGWFDSFANWTGVEIITWVNNAQRKRALGFLSDERIEEIRCALARIAAKQDRLWGKHRYACEHDTGDAPESHDRAVEHQSTWAKAILRFYDEAVTAGKEPRTHDAVELTEIGEGRQA